MYASGAPLPPQMNGVTVTINGVQAPLWYIAPGIINAQIPYETPVGAPVQVIVNNNGQTATTSFVAAAAAPGIYTDAQNEPLPNTSASVGQTISMYVTGVGALSPAISDGVAPAPTTPLNSLP